MNRDVADATGDGESTAPIRCSELTSSACFQKYRSSDGGLTQYRGNQ